MNYQELAKELVRTVRGERSQRLVSNKLGFRANQLQRWESGERRVGWTDFVRLCDICEVPVAAAVRRVLTVYEEASDSQALVRRILGGASQTKTSESTGISRYAIARWLSGKSEPALADVLALIQSCQFMLFEFLAYMVDIESLPSAVDEYERRAARKQVYYQYPEAPVVLCCFKIEDYHQLDTHEEGFVAVRLDIPIEREREIVATLEKVGKIRLVDGKYEVTEEQLELSDSEQIRAFSGYWLDRAATIMRDHSSPFPLLNCGIDMYATDEKTSAKIREEYCTFFQNVRALLQQQEGPKTQVCIINTQLIDLLQSFPPARQDVRRNPHRLPKTRHKRADDGGGSELR